MKKAAIFYILPILFSSCVVLFGKKQQTIKFESNTEDSKVIVNGDTVNSDEKSITINKGLTYIENQKEGYVSEYIFLKPKLSPLLYLDFFTGSFLGYLTYKIADSQYKKNNPNNSSIDGPDPDLFISIPGLFLTPFLIPYDILSKKGIRFKNMEYCFPSLKKLPVKDSTDNYFFIIKSDLNINKKDVVFNHYKSLKGFYKDKQKVTPITTYWEDEYYLKQEAITFEPKLILKNILSEFNLIDTNKTLVSNLGRNLYIDCNIYKAKFHIIGQFFRSSDLSVKWSLKDAYHKELISMDTTIKTHPLKKYSMDHNFAYALRQSFLHFICEKEFVEALKDTGLNNRNDIVKNWDEIKIIKEGISSTINEAIKNVVTIKLANGHGSGCIISSDGYIVTNSHVVQGEEEVTVILSDFQKLKGKVIRKDPTTDLALIKVDKSFESVLEIHSNYTIGNDIFAIGSPENINLGQTVTKGIISGKRSFNDLDYLQTDVSINQGNSGGALINSKGQLIGIVNAKMIGFGVEGIGFGISVKHIFESLKIKY